MIALIAIIFIVIIVFMLWVFLKILKAMIIGTLVSVLLLVVMVVIIGLGISGRINLSLNSANQQEEEYVSTLRDNGYDFYYVLDENYEDSLGDVAYVYVYIPEKVGYGANNSWEEVWEEVNADQTYEAVYMYKNTNFFVPTTVAGATEDSTLSYGILSYDINNEKIWSVYKYSDGTIWAVDSNGQKYKASEDESYELMKDFLKYIYNSYVQYDEN